MAEKRRVDQAAYSLALVAGFCASTLTGSAPVVAASRIWLLHSTNRRGSCRTSHSASSRPTTSWAPSGYPMPGVAFWIPSSDEPDEPEPSSLQHANASISASSRRRLRRFRTGSPTLRHGTHVGRAWLTSRERVADLDRRSLRPGEWYVSCRPANAHAAWHSTLERLSTKPAVKQPPRVVETGPRRRR